MKWVQSSGLTGPLPCYWLRGIARGLSLRYNNGYDRTILLLSSMTMKIIYNIHCFVHGIFMPKSYLYLHTKFGTQKLSLIVYTLHTEYSMFHIMWVWVHKTLAFTGYTIQPVLKTKQYGKYRTPHKTRLTEHVREDQTKQYLDRNINMIKRIQFLEALGPFIQNYNCINWTHLKTNKTLNVYNNLDFILLCNKMYKK